MSERRDQPGDMGRPSLDELTVERLLSGRLAPEDAPIGWEHVARLIEAAGGPAEPDELYAEPTIASPNPPNCQGPSWHRRCTSSPPC